MRTLLPTALLGLATITASAQWCEPTSAIPYAASMPGITFFSCNTITRASTDIEDYPNNSYVNTGMSTTLQRGSTYAVTIGFTVDQPISPHMNLRIWIDMNQDGQLDDNGETLLSVDHLAGPIYNGTITVPMIGVAGTTRMRVTAKMCSHGGHTLPTPCDFPVDPLGYHGEIEDYTAVITDVVGIDEIALVSRFAVVPEGASAAFVFTLNSGATVALNLVDASGRVLQTTTPQNVAPGEHRMLLPVPSERGLCIARLWVDGAPHALRFLH
jgi:GEVED domain